MATINQTLVTFPPHQNPKTNNLRHHHLFSVVSSANTLAQLKQVHTQILRSGFDRSTSLLLRLVVCSCAVSSGSDYALLVFNQISEPETHICNRVLRELSRSHEPDRTLQLYERMRREGIGLSRFSFPPLLKASARVSALAEGSEIHGIASKLGFDSDTFIQTALVRVYAHCGRIFEARLMFDKMAHRDVVTWSIIIEGYCQSGLYKEAFLLFDEMKSSGVEPDEMVLATILSACGRAGNLDYGRVIHEYITRKNVTLDSHLQSALITMYSNCGAMDLAQLLFDKMSPKNLVVSTAMVSAYSKLRNVEAARSIFNQMVEKDLVCWSAMISGYAESDWPQEGLKLFDEMRVSGIKPDQITMLSVISACAQLGALDQAKWIHTFTYENGFGDILPVNNALIDMYAKCGSLDGARSVFDRMPRRNVVSWTSMITALAVHGDADNALKLFQRMKDEGIKPNQVTFVGVLYACSHAGLVEKGRQVFASMVEEFNITPKHEHYGCMVDLLGRANLLREALAVVEAMPFPPNVVVWGSLLAACRVHGEVELGEFAAKRLLELEPNHDGAHVLLSNIYAKAKRWDDVGAVRNMMKQRGITKERGWSRIEINREIHEFVTADKTHRMTDMIYWKLDQIVGELKLVGYAPDACSVLVDLDEEEKKEVILWHSEKLALCLGLISVAKGSCIHIVKNLRVCEDCHAFMKLVSKSFFSEILMSLGSGRLINHLYIQMETLVVVLQHRNQYYSRSNCSIHDGFGSSPSRSFTGINCRTFQSGGGILPTPLKPSKSTAAIKKACSSPRTPPPVKPLWEEEDHLKINGKSCAVPINIKAPKIERSFSDDLCYSELWAGPAYSNSPPPSSLPIPKFSLRQKRSVSLDVPASASEIAAHPIARSAPSSPTREAQSSPRTFFLSTDSATRDLRRILHLDISDD
ncbi:hypothetical protein NE237_015835 [Protea cynaroides]|uniref:DYW domain-containing protein n=1 Tax=Protea cynaroides TaxID=273540 RepID=A0A9Q0QRL1_9MAGN|nr:hypothetical protein NE237_015835 [Protea cynaroides]